MATRGQRALSRLCGRCTPSPLRRGVGGGVLAVSVCSMMTWKSSFIAAAFLSGKGAQLRPRDGSASTCSSGPLRQQQHDHHALHALMIGLAAEPLVADAAVPVPSSPSFESSLVGFAAGALAAGLYLALLVLDVQRMGPKGTPFEIANPYRALRFLVPVLLAVYIVAKPVPAEEGFFLWPSSLDASTQSSFYAAMVAFVSCQLPLRLWGVFGAIEPQAWASVMPGSVAMAAQLASEQKKAAPGLDEKERLTPVPVLIVSGPRCCGKSTLAEGLRKMDPRFAAPEWVTTDPDFAKESGAELVGNEEYLSLKDKGDLAVHMPLHSDDDAAEKKNQHEEKQEENLKGKEEKLPPSVGLRAGSIVATSASSGACILDVDTAIARQLLDNDSWASKVSRDLWRVGAELRVVSVWVSLGTVDTIMGRIASSNQGDDHHGAGQGHGCIERLPQSGKRPSRADVIADMEWALLSRHFDFTILNDDAQQATEELQKASRYCFEDPF